MDHYSGLYLTSDVVCSQGIPLKPVYTSEDLQQLQGVTDEVGRTVSSTDGILYVLRQAGGAQD
jgi:hypothetical protein